MPPSICARTTSGFTAMPQSTAQTTRSTVNLLSLSTVTSATCATTVSNDSCTATPRPRFSPALPGASGVPQPALAAASSSAARWRGCFASSRRRNATGSLPAAAASSSMNVSVENAVCVEPTERHHSTGTPTVGECRSTCEIRESRTAASMRLRRSSRSMPSLTIIVLERVPARIDWPTMRCCQPTMLPDASSPAFSACTYSGR